MQNLPEQSQGCWGRQRRGESGRQRRVSVCDDLRPLLQTTWGFSSGWAHGPLGRLLPSLPTVGVLREAVLILKLVLFWGYTW